MKLYQLIYTSVRKPKCDDNEIEKILEACKRNNPSKDITGVLLHSEKNFIQYLEGSKDIILLYDLIKEDPRHSNVVLLGYAPLKERVFPSWHMGYKNVSRDQIDFLTEGNPDDKKVFQSIIKGEAISDSSAVNLLVRFFKKP